jgi:hypothetical protein
MSSHYVARIATIFGSLALGGWALVETWGLLLGSALFLMALSLFFFCLAVGEATRCK